MRYAAAILDLIQLLFLTLNCSHSDMNSMVRHHSQIGVLCKPTVDVNTSAAPMET